MQTHSQSSKARDRHKPYNSHREAEGEVGEGVEEEARTMPAGLRRPMLLHLSSYLPRYKKRPIEAEEEGVVGAEVGEEEEAQRVSHSAWPPAVVNSADH